MQRFWWSVKAITFKYYNNKLITYKIHYHKSEIKSVRIDASYDMPVISLFFMAYFDERFFESHFTKND
jgi:hypothetical protein